MQIIYLSIFVYVYYFIAMYFFVCFGIGRMRMDLKNKQTGKYVEFTKIQYFFICLVSSIAWPYLLLLMKEDNND